MDPVVVLDVLFFVGTCLVLAQAVWLHSRKYPHVEDSNTFGCTMYRAVSNARSHGGLLLEGGCCAFTRTL